MKTKCFISVALSVAILGCSGPSKTTSQNNGTIRINNQPVAETPATNISQPETTNDSFSPEKLFGQLYGSYEGILPCSDCNGVVTQIHLGEDGYYELSQKFIGKESPNTSYTGSFSFDHSNAVITLNDFMAGPNKYLTRESSIIQLDQNGNLFSGVDATKYILQKID